MNSAHVESTVTHVRRMLCLDEDGPVIEEHLMQRDAVLGRYVQHYRGFRPILLGSPWEALLWAVAGQLIGVQQARIIKQRLVALGGWTVDLETTSWPLPPNPKRILASGVDALRAIGLSRTKASAIVQAAEAVQSGTLDLRLDQPATTIQESLATLESIAGIGPWTTAIVALRGYGDLDVLPVGDAAIQSIVARHQTPTETRLTAERLQRQGEVWMPYRGWATYLWWLQLQAEALVRKAESRDKRGR